MHSAKHFHHRIFILLLLSACILPTLSPAQSWKKEIRKFRKHLDEHYRNPETSPLEKEDLPDFKSHNYFPMDKAFRVTAQLERTPDAEPFIMATVSGKKKTFRKFANLVFQIDDETLTIAAYLYRDPETGNYDGELFLPFKDDTSGDESYGGGRYIDMPVPAEDAKTVVLDFNQCYNPYCAYSSGWNCPIPPVENHLNIPIRAGTMAWESDH